MYGHLKSTAKLKNILGNCYVGVCKLNCGEIDWRNKKLVLNRSIELQEDNMKRKWEASGASEHSKDFMSGLIGCTQ